MTKSLTQMAAEIIAARIRHEAMTSQQIADCLNGTFEALQKLKEKEDIIPESVVQEPTEILKQPAHAKTEPEPNESPVQDLTEKPKSPKKETIAGTILNLIKSNPKGIDTSEIMEQTGFNKSQVWTTVSRAKKIGEIKTTKRGIYVSVKSHKRK